MRPTDPRLLRLVPSARRPVLLLVLVGAAQGVAAILGAFALAALVVAVVRGTSLTGPATGVAVIFGVRAALGYASERVAARAGLEVSVALRRSLLAGWLAQTAEHQPPPDAASTLAAQGTTSVETYVARYLPALVTSVVVPLLAIVTLAVTDWPSALVVVLTLPLLPLFAALIGRTTREATERRWAAMGSLAGHFLDVVQGLPTLVAYGRGEHQVVTVRRTSERHRVETLATLRLAFLSSAALELLATISVAMVAVTVGLRLASGGLDLRVGLIAILLAPEAYWPIRRVGAEFHAAADGAAALDSIVSALDAGPAADADGGEGPSAAEPKLRMQAVTYQHPGAECLALNEVDMVAPRGLTVVTGPSGAGKTTLLEVAARLREPSAGQVSGPAAHLVTQRPLLLPASIRDNLTLGTSVANQTEAPDEPHQWNDRRLWDALRAAGLAGVVAQTPGGLDTVLGDDGFGLSAGERARLALARAALSPAAVVLLDEPTAHLDSASVTTVHALIVALARTRIVVAVSHRPELAALADQQVCLARPAGDRARPSGASPATPTVAAST
ncbi:thiol reductant ABC exporter subunit CydD [Lapillicoccus sp.]|uniref:thiol reductant ABC exporter subunit CydD n=1 Tax=Lapillicoccus sp. TaxID=1909287 RepID=UPI003264B780